MLEVFWNTAANPIDSSAVKRFTPVVVVALVAAAALAILRGGDETEPDEAWKPVRPT